MDATTYATRMAGWELNQDHTIVFALTARHAADSCSSDSHSRRQGCRQKKEVGRLYSKPA